MSYIISKSGYTEINADPLALAMDLNTDNRGKLAEDCEYAVESEPDKYFITENGIEKQVDEIVAEI